MQRWRRAGRGIAALACGVAAALASPAVVGPMVRTAGAASTPTTTMPPTTTAPSGTTSGAPVGRVTRTFVDRTRKTPADASAGLLGADRRTLPTTIYYPARGAQEPGVVTADARPARGTHPLVLFNPGSPGTPEDYEVLLADWAAHGYVVAAIEFPISSVAGPDDAAWKDLPAQTKDARFVLDKVLALDAQKAGIPEIDADRIAVAGHSFGGATALSLASKCCRDGRVDAVLALAAVTVTDHGPALKGIDGPILFVHGRNDRAVSWSQAAAKCRTAGGPKRFLTIEEIRGLRAHVIPFLGRGDPYSAVARPATVDFLDGYLRDRKAARDRLERAGAGTDVGGVTRCPAEPATSDTPSTTTTTGG